MLSLSRRMRARLKALQTNVLELAELRRAALRILLASRHATTAEAQRDFWLEFVVLDQEYQYAVRRLALFCRARHSALAAPEEARSEA